MNNLVGIISPATWLLDVLRRKHGGPVKSSRPYLVGEDGPELIVPKQNGTVLPLNKTKSKNNVLARIASGEGGSILRGIAKGKKVK